MTRSRIQRIQFLLPLLILAVALCDATGSKEPSAPVPAGGPARPPPPTNVPQESKAEGSVKKAGAPVPSVVQKVNEQQNAPLPEANRTLEDITSKSSVDTNRTIQHRERLGDSLNPGALLRGIYVFVGLSVLVMAYIVFRSFRLSKTRAQMVRKYGVLAHRQDVEMRPLPLEEEDDEDTTVFDASNVMTNNVQHQNL